MIWSHFWGLAKTSARKIAGDCLQCKLGLGLATVPKANDEIFDSNNSRHDMLRYFRPSMTPMRDDWLDDRECAGVELKTSI